MVDTTNNLRPDLVLLTGDLINYELSDLSGSFDLVRAMPGRYGHYMIEGNHDLIEDAAEFRRRAKASGIPFLRNEAASITVRGHPVQLFGLRWSYNHGAKLDGTIGAELGRVLKQRDPDAFPIFLAHHPHAFDAAVRENLPLTLSGHTHGGQLMLNNQYGAGSVLFRYWSGLYKRDRSQMVVSNGVGNMFPIRVNAPAEVVHLTLRCTDARV
jgi:predicted MPP superfamily phosphohydrolase